MSKVKKKSKSNTFNYNQNRKKLKKKFRKKANPRIENKQIREAWDPSKSLTRNLHDMGLVSDPNRILPIKKESLLGLRKERTAPAHIVIKPYVVNQLEEEANLPVTDTKTLSSDLIMYVQHMIREHKDNYKAMARDEKNYYQDTPKQIKRKINEYKRCHSQHYDAFVASLATPMSH
ncbi:nucleolar protein 16 isoform X1 [Hippocampus zosterae]|uniref:nucleolar protein 16 isoform X1 n=1 Tax=Hippocampus zosterae TaxID=109293 RepID=UPI00223C94E8|nr:nucleolar protein 16 isoform X1 [Hippocampus zosterae]